MFFLNNLNKEHLVYSNKKSMLRSLCQPLQIMEWLLIVNYNDNLEYLLSNLNVVGIHKTMPGNSKKKKKKNLPGYSWFKMGLGWFNMGLGRLGWPNPP